VLSAAPDLMAKGSAMGMEFPRRVILGKGQDWRDVPYVPPSPCPKCRSARAEHFLESCSGLNAWFMATMFPMMAVEDSMQWNGPALPLSALLWPTEARLRAD
jgi:hypothetical protein